MSHPRPWLDGDEPFVGDASVWINLAATGQMESILRSMSRRFLITRTALDELETGREKGRYTAEAVASVLSSDLVGLVELDPAHGETFISLVAGTTSETLDDGEAATLAYAYGVNAIALVDERKATSIAKKLFPNLSVVSTSELLLAPRLMSSFTSEQLADLFFGALSVARMRVPDHLLSQVCAILGCERLPLCPSIPARFRAAISVESLASGTITQST